MPAKVTGDYSMYPAEIREAIPYVTGEVSELRNHWQIYHYFFMGNEKRTDFFGDRAGPLLGIFQSLLGSQMILSISRLMDKSSHRQENLTLRSLLKAIPRAKTADFEQKVNSALNAIGITEAKARDLRNKQIAHLDWHVSLGSAPLPNPLLSEIKLTMEQMEAFLNLFHWEFERTTVGYDGLSSGMIYEPMIRNALKSEIYDELVGENKIPLLEFDQRLEKFPWLLGD